MSIRTRIERLEETALPQAIQHICLVTCPSGKEPAEAEAEVEAAYLAKHGRVPDGYIHLVSMGAV